MIYSKVIEDNIIGNRKTTVFRFVPFIFKIKKLGYNTYRTVHKPKLSNKKNVQNERFFLMLNSEKC